MKSIEQYRSAWCHTVQYYHGLLVILASVSFVSCSVAGNDDSSPPTADFSAGCLTIADSLVSFNNLSANASRYNWSFGNGDSSSARSPAIRYSDTGMYSVRLVAENSAGVRDSMTRTIHISPHPPGSLTLSVPFVQAASYLLAWAASVEMVLRHNGIEQSQCQVAMTRLNLDCCARPDECNVGTSVEDIRDAFYRSGSLQSEMQVGAMALDDVRKEIAQGRPIVAMFTNGTYGYTEVIYGYDNYDNLYVHDPQSYSYTIPYQSFIYQGTYGWQYSVYCVHKE
jgi:PKD repeat protein